MGIELRQITQEEKRRLEIGLRLGMQGFKGNIKECEIKLQEIIEDMFPNECWWKITSCDIFLTLLQTENIMETIYDILRKTNTKKVKVLVCDWQKLKLHPYLVQDLNRIRTSVAVHMIEGGEYITLDERVFDECSEMGWFQLRKSEFEIMQNNLIEVELEMKE